MENDVHWGQSSTLPRVLLSAFACEPHQGSEPEVGWQWAVQAARFHEVWVITRLSHKAGIESELSRAPVDNLHFHYHDIPMCTKRFRFLPGAIYLQYLTWQYTALREARNLDQEVSFDLAHHITFVSLRFPTFLAWFGKPFIWGPLAGGERTPRALFRHFGPGNIAKEMLREVSSLLARVDPLVQLSARRASAIVAVTPDTRDAISRKHAGKITIFPAIAADLVPIDEPAPLPQEHEPFRVIFVGRLVYWKGVQYALKALAMLIEQGRNIEFSVIGGGPQQKDLQALAARLGISHQVSFRGHVPREEVLVEYSRHHLMVFPSLHDSGGFSVVEAMASGLPVICLSLGGPALAVSDESGVRVPVSCERQVERELAAAISRLMDQPDMLRRMSSESRKRISELYSWDAKGEFMREIYGRIKRTS